MSGAAALIEALRAPERLAGYGPVQWDLLVRQARASRLLGRLAAMIDARGETGQVPPAPRAHLQAARIVAQQQRQAVEREVEHLQAALLRLGMPFILLKGAAYVCADLPPADGRLFSDVDILVPKGALPDAEAALMLAGWASAQRDPYDQRYYRSWMHELPPMQHLRRGTVVDVHHAITPPTARWRADSERMRAGAVALPGRPDVQVLAPTDMVLHSATHLFLEGETDGVLRDLVDLDLLLRHFGRDPQFCPALVERAAEVGLGRPLYLALRYLRHILDTPVGSAGREGARRWQGGGLRRRLMDALYRRAFQPRHATAEGPATPFARWLLYVRGHWMRMPAHLLAIHLTRKALGSERADESPAEEARQ